MKRTRLAALICLLALAAAGPTDATPLPRKFLAGDVVIETSLGSIRVRLYREKAPATVANFLRYVDDRFYDDTVFHRVIPDFMIQGGGHDADLAEKPGRDPVKNEAANAPPNKRGTVAMARTVDPDSARAQFFINLKDNPFLDAAQGRAGYCVFGEVVAGMDVVDRIARVRTAARGQHQDVPVEAVLIKSVRRAD